SSRRRHTRSKRDWSSDVCSSDLLSIPEYHPIPTDFAIFIARPEMMALAHLLEHPVIGTQTMSTKIGGQILKRSNKDLGRVLAIRSEERRVGKECRARWEQEHERR